MLEELKKTDIDEISLIGIIICSCFLGIIGFGISLLLVILYYLTTREHYLSQKIILVLCVIGIVFALGGFFLLNGMESTGIDSVGSAVIYSFMITLGRIILIVCPIILLIIDNKKNKTAKK